VRLRVFPIATVILAALLSASASTVTLTWKLNPVNPKPPTVHTRVYRALAPCAKFTVVVAGLNDTSWTDETVESGKSYCYFTTVRNPKTGLESGKSAEIKVTVP
jgi:hypothetical protein